MLNINNHNNNKSTKTCQESTTIIVPNESFNVVLSYGKQKIISKPENCSQCNGFDQCFNDFYGVICLCHLKNYFGLNHSQTIFCRQSMLFNNPGQIYNYINKCRKWVKIWQPEKTRQSLSHIKNKKTEFSLTTYNILAQNLLLNHLYLYQTKNKSDLEWLERSNRLKQELIELNSDIYCLQEVHIENFTTSILSSLKERGYQAVFKKKTGANSDGCSILFKKGKFQLQDSLEIQMNCSNISHLLDRDQVGLVVKLRPINHFSNETSLIVANTHLIFNPKRGDIKLAQLRLLLAEIQRFAVDKRNSDKINIEDPYKCDYFPIILCGDFNSEPKSPLINFIETGQFDFQGMKSGDISGQKEGSKKGRCLSKDDLFMNGIDYNCCYIAENGQEKNNEKIMNDSEDNLTIKHVFNFKSVYPIVDKYNMQLISTSTYLDCGLVDHLFYSYNHKNLRLSAFKRLMNEQNLKKIGNLPNSILGSDHLSLSAKFYLT